jgi:hypothetical protein
MNGYLQEARDREQRRLREARAKRQVHLRFEYEDLPEYKRLHQAGRARFDAFNEALEYLFAHGGVQLGHLQVKLMNAIRMAALKRMFGDELVDNLDYVKFAHEISEIYEAVMILFPRRSGKTVRIMREVPPQILKET